MNQDKYRLIDFIEQNIDKLDWPDGFYRKDIGYKVIE